MGPLRKLSSWILEGTGLGTIWRKVARHPVPVGSATPRSAWMYVLGIATLAAFLLQLVTGVVLASKYIPSSTLAYENLLFVTERVSWGGLVRGMHFYGASAMVVLIALHMIRTFLTAAYKFPRELNWMSGVVLLVLTMAMAATGQVLRWDGAGIDVARRISEVAARIPLIGRWSGELLLNGGVAGASTLTRIYATHILLLPLLTLGIIAVHLYLVQLHGVSEPPRAEDPVSPENYRERYAARLESTGRPYVPDAMWREAVFSVLVIGLVLGFAALFGPRGPGAPVEAAAEGVRHRPDWFLLWYEGLAASAPAALQTIALLYAPIAVILALLALPLAAPAGQRHPRQRPWAVAAVVIAMAVLVALSWIGWQATGP